MRRWIRERRREEATTAAGTGREQPDPASGAGAGAGAGAGDPKEAAKQRARIKEATKKALEMRSLAIWRELVWFGKKRERLREIDGGFERVRVGRLYKRRERGVEPREKRWQRVRKLKRLRNSSMWVFIIKNEKGVFI